MHLKYYWMIDGPRYAVMIVSDPSFSRLDRVHLFPDQLHFPPEYHPSSVGEDERRVGETRPRRVSERRRRREPSIRSLSSRKPFLFSRGFNSRLKEFITR